MPPKLTQAQRNALGNIIARGGVSEHDLHMGRMREGDVRKSVAHKLVQLGLVRVEPLWTDVSYGRTRLLPAQTHHQRVNHYYATAAGIAALGHEPAHVHATKRHKSPEQLDAEIATALAQPDDEGTFYLTEATPTSTPLDWPEFRTRLAAQRAAMKLVRQGKYPRVEVWHRWRGGRYMQGLARKEGWSDV